jgi:hypothetical protein
VVSLLATLAGSPWSKRKEAEIHKRLRIQNMDEKRSLLIPVQARVGRRSRTIPRESY